MLRSLRAIWRLGRVLVHGIDLMPGKPSILGVIDGKLVVGAPGYPVSAVVCFEELLIPLLSWLSRKTPPVRPAVEVELARKVPSKLGTEELVRLAIGRVGDKFVATPLGRGAGMLTTLIRAQGVTVFLVEQNANRALSIADRGYVLETGRLVLEDTGANLLINPEVRKAYLGH